MKIALISTYDINEYFQYGKEKYWSTPRGIYDAFVADPRVDEIRWFPIAPHNCSFGFRELKRLYDKEMFVPDIIFYMSFCYNTDEYWNKETFPKSKLVVDCGDEPQTKHFNQKRILTSDLILTPDYECYLDYKSRGLNVVYTAHWTDPVIYYPSDSKDERLDVVTSMYGDRGDVVPFLQEKLGDSFILKNGLVDIQNGDLYREAKIVFQKSRNDEVTRRIFEGMSCKKLVIADRISKHKKLEDIFVENEEIVLYDSKEEALEKILYYLENKEERERIAENAYNKVMKHYTTQNVVDCVITGESCWSYLDENP